MEAYCVRCKDTVKIKSPRKDVMSNGRNCIKGSCPHCGCKLCRITK